VQKQSGVKPPHSKMELSERQMQVMKRLFEAGFRPIAIPPYESALCLHRGECAVVLAPRDGGGFKVLAPASFLVAGKFGVRVKRGERDVFVFKRQELEATPERLKELAEFQTTLNELLMEGFQQ
jgi:hypothetical protein